MISNRDLLEDGLGGLIERAWGPVTPVDPFQDQDTRTDHYREDTV